MPRELPDFKPETIFVSGIEDEDEIDLEATKKEWNLDVIRELHPLADKFEEIVKEQWKTERRKIRDTLKRYFKEVLPAFPDNEIPSAITSVIEVAGRITTSTERTFKAYSSMKQYLEFVQYPVHHLLSVRDYEALMKMCVEKR